MRKLLALLALLLPALGQAQVTLPYNPGTPVNAIDVKTKGAKCDGTTDDSPAFSATVAAVNASWQAGVPAVVSIPPGRCFINAAITQFAQFVPGRVQGAGMYQTYVVVGSGLTGNVFSWDEAWTNGSPGTPTYNFSVAHNGGSIADLTIIGNTGSGAQNAIACLDRCDFFSVENVAVWDFNGSAFTVGTPNLTTVGFMRESNIRNFKAWHDGSLTAPVINLSCITDVPTGNSDCTNEIQLSQIDIYDPRCIGVAINDQTTAVGTAHDIQFHVLRIEGGPQSTCDLLKIGDTTANGGIRRIEVYGLEEFAVPVGAVGVHIAGNNNNTDNLLFDGGHISSGTGAGIKIDVGMNVTVRDIYFGSTLSTAFTVGNSTNISCCIRFGGAKGYPTLSIDTTSAANVLFEGGQGSGNYPPWHFDSLGNLSAKSVVGTTAADQAPAGSVGEVVSIDCIVKGPAAVATTVTMTIATPAVVTWSSHTFAPSTGLANYTCPINFTTTGTLPTGVVAGTSYYIIGSTVSGDTFQISDAPDHALAGTNAVATSGSQSGTQSAYIGAVGVNATTFAGAALSLIAGDWDCDFLGEFQALTSITSTRWVAGISITAVLGAIGTYQDNHTINGSIGTNNQYLSSATVRQNINATTTVYGLDNSSFSGGTMNDGGRLSCRRER